MLRAFNGLPQLGTNALTNRWACHRTQERVATGRFKAECGSHRRLRDHSPPVIIELTDAPGGVVMEMPDGWAAYFQGLFAADADGWLVVV